LGLCTGQLPNFTDWIRTERTPRNYKEARHPLLWLSGVLVQTQLFFKRPSYHHHRFSNYLIITTMPIPDSSEDATQNEGETDPPPSTLSSPTPTSPTDSYGEGGSRPPSRAPSQPASRSGSMSADVGGGKIVPPQPVRVPSWRERRGSKAEAPAVPSRKSSIHSEKGEGLSHRFNLKDLLANGPKLNRKSSTSSRRSDSDTGDGRAKSTAGESTVSLTQKYGVCQKVAIGKGATSVVRLAHKWDRTEEKLYAVKVSNPLWSSINIIHRFPSFSFSGIP
jgi:hypothetical protein